MVTALVHDYLLVMRGAERTFKHMSRCFPGAPIYTLLYDQGQMGRFFRDHEVRPSRLQRLPIRQRGFRNLLPLFPGTIDRLDLGEPEVVLSSSSAFAHGVRTGSQTTHICYCHSPFRYIWHERERALSELPYAARPLLSRELARIRRWDMDAAGRVDHFIANSRITQQRIADFWGRSSTIIHPPVDVDRFHVGEPEDFFLIVGELVAHKRVGDAVRAAERAGRRVKIVGTGPELPRLRAEFGGRAEFLGRVQDDHLADLMARAAAVVITAVEEFGIVAVEAHAAGRPVVGPDRGGTTETVTDGETGVLYPTGDFDALAEVLREVDFTRFDAAKARRQALRFRAEIFCERLSTEVRRLNGLPGSRDAADRPRSRFASRRHVGDAEHAAAMAVDSFYR